MRCAVDGDEKQLVEQELLVVGNIRFLPLLLLLPLRAHPIQPATLAIFAGRRLLIKSPLAARGALIILHGLLLNEEVIKVCFTAAL